MASEKGSIATEAPPVPPPVSPAAVLAPPSAADTLAADPARTNSLKRPRDATPTSPSAVATAHPDISPSPAAKLARLVDSTRFTPAAPLTGQAALEDEQRRRDEEARLYPPDAISDTPALKALAALRGAAAMSRANEESAAQSAADAAAAKAIDPVAIPPTAVAAAENQAGTSPQSATSGQSLGSGHHVVHSPVPMDVDSRNDRSSYPQPEAQMEDKAVSMSYPGLMQPVAPAMGAPPQRGMSLPGHSSQNPDIAPRSPSAKKHKCPYCDTEFTRHHNLKSHLLTHSQEKPFLCQDCQMRFRRLHDLKRHSKLHTGEKPHICPKCDRKFARGDALARHSKGAGGCAGRRSSMGSFAGDDDYDGASATDADDSAMTGVIYDANEADMTEEDRRRLSLPSIKAQHVAGGPAAAEGYAPQSRTYPPATSRAAPAGAATHAPAAAAAAAAPVAPHQPNAVGAHSRASSGPSQGPSGDSSANLFSSGEGMWAYIQSLEARLQQQDEKLRMQEEKIATLETAKQRHEAQIAYLLDDVTAQRSGQVPPGREQEGLEQPVSKS